jgi:Ca-activated chloride channel family protein
MAELLAGEIAASDRAELERHLLECESCRDDFELARAGSRVEWPDVPVPPAVLEATLASIREAPGPVRFFRWATAAAALFGVAVLLVTSGRSRTPLAGSEPVSSAAARSARRSPVLATMQEPVLGTLACQDDAGRPVGDLGLRTHDVSVEILDGIAKTTVEEDFENHTDRRLEGTFVFPLPSDASISRLALEVNGKIEEGTCLERERARQVFESIVRRMQDPALLEWQPGGLFKCRIFPIEPRATKRVIVAYTQTLPCFQGKMRYVYPLASEKTRTHPPGEVRIHVLARFSGELSRMESTSHHLDVQRKDAHEASMNFRAANYRPNNDFVVALEPTEEEVRVVCHKPEGEDGYFACFATPKAIAPRVPQKYTFVLDASASISAPRLEVAKRLVRAMMERRIDGDRFEVLAHSIETWSSGEVDLRGANAFMDQMRPIGGSDVLKALEAAGPGEIIYIGKGRPSFGEMETARILDAVKKLHIRPIAVGSDANLPLLERLGGLMRITPHDEVDKRVAEIAATLGSPVISELKVEGDQLSDMSGARDVFAGERVAVVGRFKGAGTRKIVVSGRGYRRELDVAFPDREEANNPVRRLWAQRRAEDLATLGESKKAEITALGVKYQIMTPYTSFLVLENEQMWKDHQLQRKVQKQDQVLGKETGDEKKRPPVRTATPTVRPSSEAEWEDLLNKLKSNYAVDLPGNAKEADEHYRLAERYYTAGDPEKSEVEIQKALVLAPQHAPARSLLQEIQFILGKGKATPATQEYDRRLMKSALVRQPELRSEADTALERGRRLQAAGDLANANLEFRKVLEYSKWMTRGFEMEDRHRPAPELSDEAGESTSIDDPTGQVGADFSREAPARREPWEIRGQGRTMDAAPPGLPITDALPNSGKTPLTGARFRQPKGIQGMTEDLDDMTVLNPENSMKVARIGGLQGRIDGENRPSPGVEADLQVLVRQQELQLAQIQELTTKVDEHRAKLAKSLNEKSLAVAELQDARQLAERLQQDLGQLEEKHVEMALDKKHLEEKINAIAQNGGNVNTAPVKSLEGKVTAVANEIGLVVMSLGKDDGVLEGDNFSIYRGGEFVAKLVVDRADRKWAAGKVVFKMSDPRVGDDADNHRFYGASRLQRASAGKVTALAAETGQVVISFGKESGVQLGDEFAIRRGGELIARIVIDRAEAVWAAGKIGWKKSDPKVSDDVTQEAPARPTKTLSAEERLDQQSAANLDSIRYKMGLKE